MGDEASKSDKDDPGSAFNSPLADYSYMRKFLLNKLHSQAQVELSRADINSPLYSVKSFAELKLPKSLLEGIYAMGFVKPSKIQESTLPILLAEPPHNLIAQSQSGTGKTAAFLLASLSRVSLKDNYPQVIVLSPTYELAMQTGQVAQIMAKYMTGISFSFAVRGVYLPPGHKVTSHVLFGTPGKIEDWALRYHFFDIRKVKVFVLDEADVMIDTQGYKKFSIRIQKNLSHTCQILLFSATYTQAVIELATLIIPRDPILIRLKPEEESLDNVLQYFIECPNEDVKYQALFHLLGSVDFGQSFIFVDTKKSAHSLYERLTKDGFTVGLISGDLTVEERTSMLQKFRDGNQRVVVATNLLARGIDVSGVSVVFNYDLPTHHSTRKVDFETYLHRIGRTGRFGKAGIAFNLVDSPATLEMIKDLERRFHKQIIKLDNSNVESEIERINSSA